MDQEERIANMVTRAILQVDIASQKGRNWAMTTRDIMIERFTEATKGQTDHAVNSLMQQSDAQFLTAFEEIVGVAELGLFDPDSASKVIHVFEMAAGKDSLAELESLAMDNTEHPNDGEDRVNLAVEHASIARLALEHKTSYTTPKLSDEAAAYESVEVPPRPRPVDTDEGIIHRAPYNYPLAPDQVYDSLGTTGDVKLPTDAKIKTLITHVMKDVEQIAMDMNNDRANAQAALDRLANVLYRYWDGDEIDILQDYLNIARREGLES